MSDSASLQSAAGAGSDSCIVFAIAGEHFGLPLNEVDGIAAPPSLAAVPHAPPALLGAGNLAGQIVPVIDAAALLRPSADSRSYDGHGEILRLRTAAGSVGLWVDRVDYLTAAAHEMGMPQFQRLDTAALLTEGLAAPSLAGHEFTAGEARDDEEALGPATVAAVSAVSRQASVLVEVSGEAVALRQQDVIELLDHVPWSPMPRAPEALIGIGLLRGSALPVLSLAGLLGHAVGESPRGFALVDLGTRQALLGVDRLIGLRGDTEHDPFDVQSLITGEWREIVFGFSPVETGVTAAQAAAAPDRTEYLSFVLGRHQFALPVTSIERVIDAVPLIALPRAVDDDEHLADTAGAIELRGQIIPVAAIHRRLDIKTPADYSAGAYLILRLPEGHSAIGVDRVGELMSLRPDDVAPPPGEPGLICGVAVLGGSEPLSILAPEHLWRPF